MTKQEIEGKIKDLENALSNASGLSVEQIEKLQSGLSKYRAMLHQPSEKPVQPVRQLTDEQEAQRLQNIANVKAAKVRLKEMAGIGNENIQEEVEVVPPIQTGRKRLVKIPWEDRETEILTEKQIRGKLCKEIEYLASHSKAVQGRLDELDESVSLGRAATYYNALSRFVVPSIEYLKIRSKMEQSVFKFLCEFIKKNTNA